MTHTPSGADRRRNPRAEFGHSIRFKLFSRELAPAAVDGYLKDISISGARIVLDDPRGQYPPRALPGMRTKLKIALPDSDTLQLISVVQWARLRGGPNRSQIEIGLAFVEVETWQVEQIQNFLSERHTDQTMLWSAWDAYQQSDSRP